MAIAVERMAYSRATLKECLAKIKSINWTVRTKAEHSWKCLNEVQEIYNFCVGKTGCCLFNPDWNYAWRQYHSLVCENFEPGARRVRHTRKEMDKALRLCRQDLLCIINDIIHDLDAGEVDEIA